ncbi:MAG TPA: glycosyltransferase family 39 protein [Terriglobales bacterium]
MPSEMDTARWVRIGRKIATAPALIFMVALVARIRVLWQLLPEHAWINFYPWNEPSRIAWCLVSGYGYSSPWQKTPIAPTAQQPPVFPLIMAGIFKIGGAYSIPSLWMATVLNALFSCCTAVLILRLGKRDFNETTGILAAWSWAVWLYEAVICVRLWESSLTALLLMLTLWWLPRLAESRGWLAWCGFGVLAGFSCLTNSTMLAMFPCFYLWLWMQSKRVRVGARRWIAVSLAVFILALVPWTVRNYVVFHRLLPLRDNFGLELWVGNYEGAIEAQPYPYPKDFPLIDPTEYNRLGEMRYMDLKLREGLEFVREHPGEYVVMAAYRFFFFWNDPRGSWWLLPSALAWIGMVLALRRDAHGAMPYAIIMVVFPVVYYVTHTFPSYRHPMEPVILLLASFALSRVTLGQPTRTVS